MGAVILFLTHLVQHDQDKLVVLVKVVRISWGSQT